MAKIKRHPPKGYASPVGRVDSGGRKLAKGEMVDVPDPDFSLPIGTQFENDKGLFYTADENHVYADDTLEIRDLEIMLERDGMATMLESGLTLPIRRAKGTIVPAKGDSGGIAEDITKRLMTPFTGGGMRTPLDLVRSQMTSAIALRRSYHEKTVRVDPVFGGVSFSEIAHRPASSCRLLRDPKTGAMDGFAQIPFWMTLNQGRDSDLSRDGWFEIPRDRALVYVHGQDRSPLLGKSDLQVPYWAWKAKQKLMYIWFAVYLEGVALPRTMVGSDDAEGAGRRVAGQIASARSSGVILHDKQTTIDALDISGKGGVQFKEALDYLDNLAEQSALMGWLSFSGRQSGTAGAYGTVESLRDFYMLSREAVMLEIDRTITEEIIAPLTYWNHGRGAPVPAYESQPLRDQEMDFAIDMLKTAVSNPRVSMPDEFWDETYIKVGGFMGMNVDKLRASLVKAHDEAAKAAAAAGANPAGQAVAGTAAMAGKLAKGVQAAKAGKSPKKAMAAIGTGKK